MTKAIIVDTELVHREQGFPMSYSERDELLRVLQYVVCEGFIPKMGYPEAQLFHCNIASDTIKEWYNEATYQGYCSSPEEFIYYILSAAEDSEGEDNRYDVVNAEFKDKFEKCELVSKDGQVLEKGYIKK
jgi:hypothetical protein